MKINTLSRAFLVLTGTSFFASAQNEVAKELKTQASGISSSDTHIAAPLEVPVFTPPAPPMEKMLPAMRIDSAVTVRAENSRTLTLIRGEASPLPDIPVPPQVVPEEKRPLTPEEIAREANRRRHLLQIGATVFDRRVSVVHWQHPDTGESYQAVCGFDIGLLAGIGQFVRDGETYSVMLIHTEYDTSRFKNLAARMFPDLPEVLADAITFTQGDPKDSIGTAPIIVLRDLITQEKSRLTAYQEERLTYQKAASAWEKANPPVPRDETVWLRPHRGSRYLANPKPEAAVK